jgi:ComF family protein
MIPYWISYIFDLLLPRPRDAVRARSISETELASLLHPRILPGKKWVRALFPYHDERVRAVIKSIKYYNERKSSELMGALAADYILDVVAEQKAFEGWHDVIVAPIPSSPKRLRERGYNQAERLASSIYNELALSKVEGLTYNPHLLTRKDRTSQVHVMRSKRKENIRNAFSVPNPERVEGRFIILIDDVVESGATLVDARRALMAACPEQGRRGARGVIAIAMAH